MIEIFIFFLVAFLYIQIVVQYKSNENLDIYEIDYFDNINLQDTCNIMQPFVFQSDHILPSTNIKLVDENMTILLYEQGSANYPFQTNLNTVKDLFLSNIKSAKQYYTETVIDVNSELGSDLFLMDPYLKPPFTIQTEYMLHMGTVECTTPFKYHCNSRKFLVVQRGKICLKIAPWKPNKRNLHEIHDHQRNEIRSIIDVWNPVPQHRRSFEKIKFLEVTVKEGQVIYIPSYWGYSIKYQEPNTMLYDFTYSTLFNRIAFLGTTLQHYLQKGNTVYKKWPSILNNINNQTDSVQDCFPLESNLQKTEPIKEPRIENCNTEECNPLETIDEIKLEVSKDSILENTTNVLD